MRRSCRSISRRCRSSKPTRASAASNACGGWKPRPNVGHLLVDRVSVWLRRGVTLDLGQHQRPVYEARENLANRVRPFFEGHQMEIDHGIRIAQHDEFPCHDRQHAIDDLSPRTAPRRTDNEKEATQGGQDSSAKLPICNPRSAMSCPLPFALPCPRTPRTPVPG